MPKRFVVECDWCTESQVFESEEDDEYLESDWIYVGRRHGEEWMFCSPECVISKLSAE